MKGWRIIGRVRRIKKKVKTKFCSKTVCTHIIGSFMITLLPIVVFHTTKLKIKFKRSVTRPLCLVESHKLDAA